MQCAACGQSNPPGSRFCNACGTALAASGAAARARPETPAHLAERILSTRTALEGERKQVTVLFADVKGSMDLAEQIDPLHGKRASHRSRTRDVARAAAYLAAPDSPAYADVASETGGK
jgi:class 3 adenylate cyclase